MTVQRLWKDFEQKIFFFASVVVFIQEPKNSMPLFNWLTEKEKKEFKIKKTKTQGHLCCEGFFFPMFIISRFSRFVLHCESQSWGFFG